MAAEQERTQPLAGTGTSASGTVWKNRYLIERELGRGGFGVVFLARDQQLLSKPVVVKLLQDGSSPDPYFQKKFQQEIEAMARIDHPGVVGVLDTGESPDKQPFLVMQFVEGDTLRSLINKGGMEFRQAARIIRQVGQALSAAHDKGVFHRDLKPENIMVQHLSDDEIQVKLIDFGIASVRDSQVLGIGALPAQASKVVGTLAYMAPEQVMGQATGSSDIYALGVIAFEMLTGQRPEITPQGPTTKPRQIRAEIPEAAESAIVKAVSYQPEQRQARPRDFGEEIARALGAEASISAPIPVAVRPSEMPSSKDLEMAYVLFMDLVSYSMLDMADQRERIERLAEIVRQTGEYKRAQAANQIVSLPTGDGMALVFFQNPMAAVQCAVEVARALKSHNDLKLRMGVHSGPVLRIADINANSNVAGGGINMAQRVMDVGDSGHILVSKSVSDILTQYSKEWSKTLQDLGEAEVKHGVKMHVVNLVTSEVGNPDLPEKLKKARTLVEQIPSAPALPVVASKPVPPATIAPASLVQPQAPAAYQQNWNQPAAAPSKAGALIAVAAAVVVVAGLGAWKLGIIGGKSEASEQATPGALPAAESSSPSASTQPASGGGGGTPSTPAGDSAAAAGGAAGAGAVAAAAASSAKASSPTPTQVAKSAVTGTPAQSSPLSGQTSATAPTAQTMPAAASSAAGASAALSGLRSEYAMLAGRANAISNSMGRMEQQQGRMGVGMRGDMAAARESMEYLMGEAKSAISAGDADGAKRNMEMAERQVEKLEDFLGR